VEVRNENDAATLASSLIGKAPFRFESLGQLESRVGKAKPVPYTSGAAERYNTKVPDRHMGNLFAIPGPLPQTRCLCRRAQRLSLLCGRLLNNDLMRSLNMEVDTTLPNLQMNIRGIKDLG